MKLRCSNPKCITRDGTEPGSVCFNLTTTFDEYRHSTERIGRVEAWAFECVHCGDEAEDVPEDKEGE